MLLSQAGKRSHRMLGAALLLIGVTVIAYLPALKSGFIWDDENMLTGNTLIRAAGGLYRLWFTSEPADYWPVTSSTLWVEWRLWGMNPQGYHVTNLALHISESLLLWAILRRLRVPGAWLAAAIFALHPVNVESVAWIAQRKNLMAMLFFLLSIFWFLKSDPASPPAPVRLYRPGAGRWYGLSLLAFALGMLSKGSVAMLPIVLLGLIAWHRRLVIPDFLCAAPFFAVAAIFAGVDVWFMSHGAAPFVRNAGFLERLLGAAGMVWFYLYKALIPLRLIFVYPQWHIQSASPLWWIPLLAVAGTTMALWRCRRRWSRPALFAWGYFCIMLAPALGFTDIYFMKYSLVADHYQHLAIIAPIVLASAGLDLALRRFPRGAGLAVQVSAASLLCALAILTWRQCRLYTDNETLFRATIRENPSSAMAYDNLGVVLTETKRIPEAIAAYEAALKIDPNDAEIHSNLGGILATMPDSLAEAIAQSEAALKINPDIPEAHYNLGSILENVPGRSAEAIAHYETAIRIRPDYAEAHYNLANALAHVPERLPEAIAHYEAALKTYPDDAEIQNNLGIALMRMPGRTADAIAHYKAALRIRPDYAAAHNNLGIVLARTRGDLAFAIAQYESALKINPDYAEAHMNLGIALLRMGDRKQEAWDQFEAALRIRPDWKPAIDRLRSAQP